MVPKMNYYNTNQIKLVKKILKGIEAITINHYTDLLHEQNDKINKNRIEKNFNIYLEMLEQEDIVNIKKMLYLLMPIRKMLVSKVNFSKNKEDLEVFLIKLNELYVDHGFSLNNDILAFPGQYHQMPLTFEESTEYLKEILNSKPDESFELRKNSSNVKNKPNLSKHHVLIAHELGFLKKINESFYKKEDIL